MISLFLDQEQLDRVKNYKKNPCESTGASTVKDYTREDIVNAATDYCIHIDKVHKKDPTIYTLEKESLVLTLNKGLLNSLISSEECHGLYAVLCVDTNDGPNQSAVLIPYGKDCLALKPDGGTTYKAIEQWPPARGGGANGPGTMSKLTDSPHYSVIRTNVSNYLKDYLNI